LPERGFENEKILDYSNYSENNNDNNYNHYNTLLHFLFLRRHRVVTMCPPGMAFGDSLGSQPKTLKRTVNLDGLNGIL
jgi:hypothetical protein